MKIIYVHGYGGPDFDAENARTMSLASAKSHNQVPAHTHDWPSPTVRLKFQGRLWEDAKRIADEESKRLASVLTKEADKGPIYVVGHSLGCRVILGALKRLDSSARIEAVFLFAPAVHKDYSVLDLASITRRGLFAYYSNFDGVLKNAYRIAEGVPPAGRDGFIDGFQRPWEGVTNLKVSRFHNSYGPVAEGVGEVIAYWAAREKPQPELTEGGERGIGDVWWDTILASRKTAIQRHVLTLNYRAVDKSNGNKLLGWGRRAGPLLGFLARDDERLA